MFQQYFPILATITIIALLIYAIREKRKYVKQVAVLQEAILRAHAENQELEQRNERQFETIRKLKKGTI